ncbi:MAG: competence/damage-inducible protein A [Verrucomicrobia bacterium Tous-C9LFEB]|nr:MAG: competence/damage-inducible protein A [Verrucomicrobia bacterium Tous-C9LFEB]
MKIEVLNTGSELLLGHVTNTHLTYLAQELFSFGLRVERQVTVPDGAAIRTALAEAVQRADLVIVTGGLGPTSDDITRDVAAELFQRTLIYHDTIFQEIRAYLSTRHVIISDLNKNQAMVPEGAIVLKNDFGTAPGLIIEDGGKAVVLLPGPPRELKPMWKNKVEPWLRDKLAALKRPPVYERIWRIVAVGESRVQDMLEPVLKDLGEFEFGYCARAGEVDFRLITHDAAALDKAAVIIREKIGDAIYAEGTQSMESTVITLATAKGLKIATAESCTGGLVAHRLTNVPGASAVYYRGWVTYSNLAKVEELGVDATLILEKGAVSREVAKAMAEGALATANADVAVALTGIAGPDGGTPEKPVGTVWIAVATKEKTEAFRKIFSTDRETFKYMASQSALDAVRKVVIQMHK